MNTQPMDQFLNQERLTDFAQFAVSDSHDLWPGIERAARRSVTDRPSILSISLSRAWTAVGVFLIAATFAVLGLGLVVLVLSNGQDQVPASSPDSTVTPTPTETATPAAEETRQPAPTPEIETAPVGKDHSESQAQPDESTPRLEPTQEPTPTPEPTVTTTATPTSTPEPAVTPTLTLSPTPSPSPTQTSLPTATPTPTFTSTPEPAVTPTLTLSPTPTTTPTPVPSPTQTPLPTATPTPTFTPTPEPIYANVTFSEYPPESYYWIRANGSIFKLNDIRDPAPASGQVEEGMRLVAFDITQMAREDDQQHSLSYFSVQGVDGVVSSANALTSLGPLFREGRLDNGQSIRGWVSFTLPDFALIDRVRFVRNVDSAGVEIADFNPFVGLNVDGRNIQVQISRFERVTDPVSFEITSSRPECAGDDFGKTHNVRPPYQQLMIYETTIPATCTQGTVTFEVTAYIDGREQASATTTYPSP